MFICVNMHEYLWKEIVDTGCSWTGELESREEWEQNFFTVYSFTLFEF